MNRNNVVDHRLTELEIKASFAEDLLDQLNQVLVRQQGQIDALVREVKRLQQPLLAEFGGEVRQSSDELPPHY